MSPLPKVLILGWARHGKDTVGDILKEEYGFRFLGSPTILLAKDVLFPLMREEHGYATWEDCFADRSNHRAFWFDTMVAYNTPDRTRIARLVLESSDIYGGMRSLEEFEAAKAAGLFDVVVWVDASGRGLPPEPASSCTVHRALSDYTILNDGSLEDLTRNTLELFDFIINSRRGRTFA